MGEIIDKIIRTENLHWAWNKTKNSYQVGDIWYDEIELSSFESNLLENLEAIKNDIRSGTYILQPIRPIPFPKGNNSDDITKVRQTFEISVRDQVTWMAIVNVIGDKLDFQMPSWSFGHRLYVPLWKDDKQNWKIGWYTHSKGILYRKWNQSWPLFRRSISLTAKIMCADKDKDINHFKDEDLDKVELSILNNNDSIQGHFKIEYFNSDYWENRSAPHLYWATIDFSKFYPKIKRSAILENIIKYYETTDVEFKQLLTSVMDFRIDYTGWKEEDLNEIGLKEAESFNGLPTGLFVAGFLANVGMLTIDFDILNNLNIKRKVAHFRFVDDHVILAYEFDELLEWIKSYNSLLVTSNTGIEFNYDKLEPKSLGNILNEEWLKSNSENIDKETSKAKKKSKLDPAFPAPLMTKTLAKVSAINNSDFEFLSHNEEEQLISDLEHLLLTDFPDHELRKDTRVSYAASVLSRIVPNTNDDYSVVYECQRKLYAEIQKFIDKYETSKTEHQNELVFEKLPDIENYFKEWIDSTIKDDTSTDDKKEEADDKKKRINRIKALKIQELNAREAIEQNKKSQKKRIYNLLNKAISENPEKVRIWSRVIDYCRKVGCCNVKDTYDKIDELTKVNIHPLSAPFLKILFLNVLADRILKVVYEIINNHLSQKEKDISRMFLETIFCDEFCKDIFINENIAPQNYISKTFELHRFVLGSTIFILEKVNFKFKYSENITQDYKLIDWNNNPLDWVNNTSHKDINSWLYWLLWKTHDKSISYPLPFWMSLQVYIDYEKPTFKPLIIPFPNYNYLPRKENEFLSFLMDNDFDEGWLYQIFKTGIRDHNESTNLLFKERLPNIYNNALITNSLWDFIVWQKEYLDNFDSKNDIEYLNKYFDPRLSEWFALEILKQVIRLCDNNAEDFLKNKRKDIPINLANFDISENAFLVLGNNKNDKLINTWEYWKTNCAGIVSAKSKWQIYNPEFTPIIFEEEIEQSKIHAFGIILLQLITHNIDLPWIWNSTEKSIIWEHLIYKKIQNSSVSSYTLLILQACFSSKNREKFYNQRRISDFIALKNKFPPISDVTHDIPEINDVLTLVKYVSIAQEKIEKYQLTMEDNIPRQLIPISLIQLSNRNNPFAEQSDNENLNA